MENDSFPQSTDAARHIHALTRREALVSYVRTISKLEVLRSDLSPEYLHRLMNITCGKDPEMEGLPLEYRQEIQDTVARVLDADFLLSISGPRIKYPLLAVLEILLSGIAMVSDHNREVAVQSFRDMLAKMDVEDVSLVMLPSFARLASNRDFEKSRQSASELLPDIYFAVGEDVSAKMTIQNIAATLSKDSLNSVVASISQSLSVCVERGMSNDEVTSFILPLYNGLTKDDHSYLYKALGVDVTTQKHLAQYYGRLLGDNMFVVRQRALEIMQEIMLLMEQDTFDEFIMPKLNGLASDIFSQVRLALAKNIKEIWAYMNENGYKEDSKTVLVSVISALLQDNVSSEVLLCTLEHLSSKKIANTIPVNSSDRKRLRTDIAHAIKQIFDLKDRQWRYRQYLLDMIPDLVSGYYILDEEKPFSDVLLLMVSALCDSVWSVRMCAIDSIPKFMSVVSEKRCYSSVRNTAILSIASKIRDAPHSGRTAALKVLNSLMPIFSYETILDSALPSVISAISDPVPTVRLYAAQVLLSVKNRLASDATQRYDAELHNICATIDTLKQDEDERLRLVIIGTMVMA